MRDLITIENKKGMEVILSPFGASIFDIKLPVKGSLKKESVIVHSYDYENHLYNSAYFGKTCGRTAGRIKDGKFIIDGKEYTIQSDLKDGLHGGNESLAFKKFMCEENKGDSYCDVVFSYTSEDGEGGYPGQLKLKITYRIFSNENKIRIIHTYQCSKKSIVCLNNHAYFNLSGDIKRNVLDEKLYLNSSLYGEVDDRTLSIKLNSSKEYDFKTLRRIGDYISSSKVLLFANGYDNPFLLDEVNNDIVQAKLVDEESNRSLEVRTSYNSCVVYTANYPVDFPINNKKIMNKHDGICLEMQFYPNGINLPFIKEKREIVLPQKEYMNFIEYKFVDLNN